MQIPADITPFDVLVTQIVVVITVAEGVAAQGRGQIALLVASVN